MNPYNAAGGGGGGVGGGPNPFGAPASSAGYAQQPSMGYGGYEEQATTGYDQGGINYGQQQQAAGYGPAGARPRVDVEASGEVDPNL